MIGHWIAFSVILIVLVFGAISLLMIFKSNQNLNKEELKRYIPKTILLIIYFWLYDFLYMAIFNNWLLWIFMFGSIIVLTNFYSLITSFINIVTNKKVPLILLAFELLGALALTSYLIFIIPDNQLQTIILTIVAAVYGGFITLLGVAWTIKATDKNRHEDLLLKAKPVFSFENVFGIPNTKDYPKYCFTKFLEDCGYNGIVYVVIENSKLNFFNLVSVIHDGKEFNIEGNFIVLPSARHLLQFNFDSYGGIYLKIKDSQNIFHYYKLELLKIELVIPGSDPRIHTVREINLVENGYFGLDKDIEKKSK